MAIDPAALKADILATPELATLWANGNEVKIVEWYTATSDTDTPVSLPAASLRDILRGQALTLGIYAAEFDGAATKETKAAAKYFLQVAESGATIDRDDTAFKAAVDQLVTGSVITDTQRTALRNKFTRKLTVAEVAFGAGAVVTRTDVQAARKL